MIHAQANLRDRAARFRGVELDAESVPPPRPAELDAIGYGPEMIEIYTMIGAIADIRAPVLVRGEPGSGKERIARAIHRASSAAARRFVPVACGDAPALEADLFGHVQGALSEESPEKRGAMETAGDGTIYLTDITRTAPSLQTRLLRVLQSGEFYPAGADTPRRTSARLVVSSEDPLERLVREGRFREDLYFRLRVIEITVPPLRERRNDIPALAAYYLKQASREMETVPVLSDAALARLQSYDWPGNVRELEATLYRAALVATSGEIPLDALQLDRDRSSDEAVRTT